MLTKNSRIALRHLNENKDNYYTINDIAKLCGFERSEAERVVKFLLYENFLEHQEPLMPFHGKVPTDNLPVRLTELGVNYRMVQRRKAIEYIADKWVDIIACAISILAIIISVQNRIPS